MEENWIFVCVSLTKNKEKNKKHIVRLLVCVGERETLIHTNRIQQRRAAAATGIAPWDTIIGFHYTAISLK